MRENIKTIMAKLEVLNSHSKTFTAARIELLKLHRDFIPKPRLQFGSVKNLNFPDLLKKIFESKDGIIFGEEHTSYLTTKFIAKHMLMFAKMGVETLFFEGVDTDKNTSSAHKLEYYGKGDMYRPMIDEARKHGIHIIGIDSVGSRRCGNGYGVTRDLVMNSHAYTVISNKNTGRWVALVGRLHLNNCIYIDSLRLSENAVRGLAELTNAASIIIQSNPSIQYEVIKVDTIITEMVGVNLTPDFVIESDITERIYEEKNDPPDPLDTLSERIKALELDLCYQDIDTLARYNDEHWEFTEGRIFRLDFSKWKHSALEELQLLMRSFDSMIPHHEKLYNSRVLEWVSVNFNDDNKILTISCDSKRTSMVCKHLHNLIENLSLEHSLVVVSDEREQGVSVGMH